MATTDFGNSVLKVNGKCQPRDIWQKVLGSTCEISWDMDSQQISARFPDMPVSSCPAPFGLELDRSGGACRSDVPCLAEKLNNRDLAIMVVCLMDSLRGHFLVRVDEDKILSLVVEVPMEKSMELADAFKEVLE